MITYVNQLRRAFIGYIRDVKPAVSATMWSEISTEAPVRCPYGPLKFSERVERRS